MGSSVESARSRQARDVQNARASGIARENVKLKTGPAIKLLVMVWQIRRSKPIPERSSRQFTSTRQLRLSPQ